MNKKVLYIVVLLEIFLSDIPSKAQSFYTAWEKRYDMYLGSSDDAKTITVDLSGNVIVSSNIKTNTNDVTKYVFLTIKYNAEGNQLWAVESAPQNNPKELRYVKTDALGNIYVAGYDIISPGDPFDYNGTVIKYSPAGVQQWVYVYDGNLGDDPTADFFTSLDIDENGNVYLIGKSLIANNWNMLTIKINSSGAFEWKNLLPINSHLLAGCIIVDNILEKVYAAEIGGIASYAFNGTELWHSPCAVDPKIMLNAGNLYLGWGTLSQRINISKLNHMTGQTIWTVSKNADGNFGKYTIDKAGNLFACAWTSVDSLTAKWIILKYNSGGVLQWEKNLLADKYLCDINGIEIDDSLNIYIAGTTTIKPPPIFNYVKRLTSLVYNKDGNLLQENNYLPAINNGYLQIADYFPLAVNKNSFDYYIAGRERVSTINPAPLNFVTINYRSTALLPAPVSLIAEAVSSSRINLNWKYNSPAPIGFVIERSFEECSEYFYHDSIPGNVTSYADTIVGPGTFYCYRVYAYTDSTRSAYSNTASDTTFKPVGILNISGIIPKEYKLYQNYPNPFNPVTSINFDLPKSSSVTIKVYNIIGKEVALLVNGVYPAGKYNLKWNAEQFSSGIYFYKIESDGFTQVKRMALVK